VNLSRTLQERLMARVCVDGRRVLIDGEPFPLIGGEIHYWRHDAERWPALLDAAASLGLTFVGTYLCWQFHEAGEGVHDFSGDVDPRRDVARFFGLAAERGLRIFARPGPYIYAEWRNQGVPDHAARLPKSDPAFREKASRWLRDASALLRPLLATRGGPVFLVQADNESDPAIHVHGEALGLGESPGRFQAWLADRYGDVDALNRAWGTRLGHFDEARAVLVDRVPGRRRAFLDACDFRYHLAADHAAFAVGRLREAGIDVPIVLNTWPGHDAQDWWTFSALADVHGIDPYPANLYRGYEGEHRYHRERFRYQRALGKLPFIAEFGSGVWRGHEKVTGVFDPEHYRLAAFTAFAGGTAGWNWYMLVNRDNWLMAPVQSTGWVRPDLGPVFRTLARVARRLDPAGRSVAASFGAAWSSRHHQLAEIGEGRNRDEVLIALDALGLEFDFVDIDRDREARPPVLFYAGPEWLARSGQEGLVRYVRRGGVLVFHRSLPLLDEDRTPLNLLDLPTPDGTGHPAERRVALKIGGVWVEAAGPALRFRAPPGAPVEAREVPPPVGENERLQYAGVGAVPFHAGVRLDRGAGRIVVLGAAPTRESLLAVLEDIGAAPPCRPLSPGVIAALLHGPDFPALVVINPGDEAVMARIRLQDPGLPDGAYRMIDLETDDQEPATLTAGVTTIGIPRRGGRVVLLVKEGGDVAK